jgi:hypothetical protein
MNQATAGLIIGRVKSLYVTLATSTTAGQMASHMCEVASKVGI